MKKYKPEFMGKVIPADDPTKLTEFVTSKYDAFSKVYDACKDQAEKIDTVSPTNSPQGASPDTLSIKVSTDNATMKSIEEAIKDDDSVSVSGDVITAKGDKK